MKVAQTVINPFLDALQVGHVDEELFSAISTRMRSLAIPLAISQPPYLPRPPPAPTDPTATPYGPPTPTSGPASNSTAASYAALAPTSTLCAPTATPSASPTTISGPAFNSTAASYAGLVQASGVTSSPVSPPAPWASPLVPPPSAPPTPPVQLGAGPRSGQEARQGHRGGLGQEGRQNGWLVPRAHSPDKHMAIQIGSVARTLWAFAMQVCWWSAPKRKWG